MIYYSIKYLKQCFPDVLVQRRHGLEWHMFLMVDHTTRLWCHAESLQQLSPNFPKSLQDGGSSLAAFEELAQLPHCHGSSGP